MIGSTSVAVALLMLTTPAATPGGHVAGRHQEAELLHSTQLTFTPDGVPVLTIGLMDRQEEVTVSARGGLEVSLSGNAGSTVRVPPGDVLSARVLAPEAGETRYRVVLEGLRGGDLDGLRKAKKRWTGHQIQVETIELGGIVGYPGRLLDNRGTLVVEPGFHETREAAEARASEIAERLKLEEPPRVFAEPVRRAQGTIVATASRSRLQVQQRDLLVLRAADGGLVDVARVEYGRGYRHHGFQDRSFHGAIVLAIDPTGRLAVVNRVPAEALLKGLVPSETFPTAPAAALDAQAITARGELLAKIGVRHLADPFLVCATQHCQVYSGTAKEKATTNAAVDRTRGLMLFDEGGKLVDSVYSASCGGHTEHNEHVWDSAPQETLRGTADVGQRKMVPWRRGAIPNDDQVRTFLLNPPPGAYCGTTSFGNKVFRWEKALPPSELDRMVNAQHPIGRVKAIEIVGRGVSGRVTGLRFVGERGAATVMKELPVRRLLGNLRSGLFVVERRRATGDWVFLGGGHGHGVGMCQYGAIGMAERGKDASDILGHYYGGASVAPVY